MNNFLLHVVIPCFNEGPNIEKIFRQIKHWQTYNLKFLNHVFFTIINDGSTDNTIDLINICLAKYPLNNLEIITSNKNQGLSYVELFMSKSKAHYVLGLPGDLRFNVECITNILELDILKFKEIDLIVFSDSKDRRGFVRMSISQIVNILVLISYIGISRRKLEKNIGLICLRPELLKFKPSNLPNWGSMIYYKYLILNDNLKIFYLRFENIGDKKYTLIDNIKLYKRLYEVVSSTFILFRNRKVINDKIVKSKH